jgi:hypothetical protein
MRSAFCKKRDLLHQIILQSGFYRKTLKFPTKRDRLNFLVALFKPKKEEITANDKRAITRWLKNQGLKDWEIRQFYLETGISNKGIRRW